MRLTAAAAGTTLVAAILFIPSAGSATLPAAPAAEPGGRVLAAADGEEPTGLWTVQLADPPLAAYRGGVAGLAATSPAATGADRLDVAAPASQAYLARLTDRQDRFTAAMERRLDRTVEVAYAYRSVVNGLAVRVSEAEAEALASLPGVAAVYQDVAHQRQTDRSHDLIGSGAVWDGATGPGLATRGEGVVVGMLDTGVNPDHPSFAATDGTGYTHTNPLGGGNYLGVCDPEHPRHDPFCNAKLIGAWSFHPFSPTGRDLFDHGSHVGSTIAGNVHEITFRGATRTVQGVAPRANVISYQVCFPTCPETATVAAVEQAIADPTQVLNYSIEGRDNPWNDLVSRAFLDAYQAGIFVAASAGNSGPDAGTAAKTAPWNASVAATNHARLFGHPVAVTGPEPGPEVAGLAGDGSPAVPGEPGELAAELREAGLGCQPYEDGALAGAIGLIARGDCSYRDKVLNAAAAGAVAVVVSNHQPGPPVTMGGLAATPVPAVMIAQDAGQALRELLAESAPEPVTLRIGAQVTEFTDPAWAETVAEFSSRGPSRFELLAPTLAAPGVAVLAAAAPVGDDPAQYLVASGTSMASPHVAGAGALLFGLHPDWSPARIRSALAGTAHPLAAGPFDVGSGRLDVAAAARVGLVLDETHAHFLAANPGSGGDPKTLNVPSLVDHGCAASCSWTRTLTHVGAAPAGYTATGTAPDGAVVTVDPAEFTLDPGASRTVRITLDLDPAVHPAGDWVTASVGFTTDATHPGGAVPVAGLRFPITAIATDPDQITLAAEAYQTRGSFHAELTWAGATSEAVDLWRDGELVATVPTELRRYHDDLGRPRPGSTFGYRVCRVGSQAVCSPEQTVEIGRGTEPRPRVRITTTALPDLNPLERYRHPLHATGGSGSYQWEATGLPAGLVLDPDTGMLAHDPDAPPTAATGPAEVTVTLRDGEWPGPVHRASFTLAVLGIEQVAAGWGHTCAITTEQTAYCWGRDATGQIGRGVVGGDGVHVPLPTPVLGPDGERPLAGVTQIAGGDGHTCALTTEGTVYCWGAAFDGRLGDGDPRLAPKPLPVQVRGPGGDGHLTDVVQIAVGWQFGCAVTAAEELYCWGNNGSGKLGTGDEVGAIVPVPAAVRNPAGTGPLTGVSTVAAGSASACAVADGTPYCWGRNFQGQLGIGHTSPAEPLPVPVQDPPAGITQLAAGSGHTCAVTGDGAAYCWGDNGSGQLGSGETGGRVPAVGSITVDGNHTCALAGPEPTAYCWGFSGQGQLGNGELDGPPVPLPAPVLDPGGAAPFPGVESVTAGSSHNCALVGAAAVYCWGANFNWQLGIGETDEQHRAPLPVPTQPGL